MNPFFSRRSVLKHEEVVQQLTQRFCERVKEMLWSQGVVPLSLGFTCLTTDLINSFVLDRNLHYLDTPDWLPQWGQALRDASKLATVTRQVTWILPILKSFPISWAEKMNPGLGVFFNLAKRVRERIEEVCNERHLNIPGDPKPDTEKGKRKYTLLDQVLDSKLAPEDKSPDRLEQEVRSALGAGTETTTNGSALVSKILASVVAAKPFYYGSSDSDNVPSVVGREKVAEVAVRARGTCATSRKRVKVDKLGESSISGEFKPKKCISADSLLTMYHIVVSYSRRTPVSTPMF
jgi:hypothetical protein